MRQRRALTIGHSYVVTVNRRFAHEMARVARGRWEITVAAPRGFHGDLGWIDLTPTENQEARLAPVRAHFTRSVHTFLWGVDALRVLHRGWDLVHAWQEPYVISAYQLALALPSDVPLVFATFQNLQKVYPPPVATLERAVMRRARCWIAFGETVSQTLAQRAGYCDRPHTVIPPGVDVDAFHPDSDARREVRRRLSWEDAGPPVIGYLGRFVPEKGLHMLLRVLDAQPSPWRALFVGGGPLEHDLRAWGAKHGDRVRVVTGVTHDHVPAHLAAMDVLCAPSQTTRAWREQFGRMLVEAMASEVAVVGSDSGEIPFTVGEAGRIVGEADEAGWGRALAELVESEAERRRLGAAGRERAVGHFAWPVVARRTLELFDRVCDERR